MDRSEQIGEEGDLIFGHGFPPSHIYRVATIGRCQRWRDEHWRRSFSSRLTRNFKFLFIHIRRSHIKASLNSLN
jgi:hypothetical protein